MWHARAIDAVDERLAGEAFAEPFEPGEVKWKPQSVKGNRAMAMCYIDARLVMDRLDEVVGGTNWQDAYEVLNDGSVVCRLAVRMHRGGEWVTKTDVGSTSEQPDGGDRLKAAFSDALKRAAVKFGIGRYLYRLKSEWVDYDPQKKQLLQKPELPVWGKPGPSKSAGERIAARLALYESRLLVSGLCEPGELIRSLCTSAAAAGYAVEIRRWTDDMLPFLGAAAKAFEAARKAVPSTARGSGAAARAPDTTAAGRRV